MQDPAYPIPIIDVESNLPTPPPREKTHLNQLAKKVWFATYWLSFFGMYGVASFAEVTVLPLMCSGNQDQDSFCNLSKISNIALIVLFYIGSAILPPSFLSFGIATCVSSVVSNG